MPIIFNPYVLMALQWAVVKGTPLVMSRFVKTAPIEETVFEGLATLQRGREDIGGLLSITATDIVFTPASVRRPALRIPLEEIEQVTLPPRRLLGLIPLAADTVKVRSQRGIYRFMVDKQDGDRWLQELRAALARTDIVQVPAG